MMRIGGFQKLTLLDFPGKTGCILFTPGCNFRCPYCHNAELLREPVRTVNEEEIWSYLRRRRGLLDGVCVSGGEPMMQPDLIPFLRELRDMGYAVKVDTNGSFPEILERIIREGLADYIAMDVKNSWELYPKTAGLSRIPQAEIARSVGILKENDVSYEFRTTVVHELHTADGIREIAELLQGARVWYLQPYRDAPCVPDRSLSTPAREEMDQYSSIGNCYVKTIIRQ